MSCVFGGIAALEPINGVPEEIISPVCASQGRHDANFRLYSRTYSLTVVRNWYERYSFVTAVILVYGTRCRPVHINECKLDYLCHCSALLTSACRYYSRLNLLQEGLTIFKHTLWPDNKDACRSYLKTTENELRGKASVDFGYKPVESGHHNVPSVLLNLTTENDCIVIKVRRTSTQLADLREDNRHRMFSRCEFQLRPQLDGPPGTQFFFDVHGYIVPRSVRVLTGKETVAFYGNATSIVPKPNGKKPVHFSSFLSNFEVSFLTIDSNDKHSAVRYLVTDKSPYHVDSFAIYVSLLSQLTGSWVDITVQKEERNMMSTLNTDVSVCLKYNTLMQLPTIASQNNFVVKMFSGNNKSSSSIEKAVVKYSALGYEGLYNTSFYSDKHSTMFSLSFCAEFDNETQTVYFSSPLGRTLMTSITLLSPRLFMRTPFCFNVCWIYHKITSDQQKGRDPLSVRRFKNYYDFFLCSHQSATFVPYYLWCGREYISFQKDGHYWRGLALKASPNNVFSRASLLLSWANANELCSWTGATLPEFTSRAVLQDFAAFIAHASIPIIEAAFIGLKAGPAGVRVFDCLSPTAWMRWRVTAEASALAARSHMC